MLRKTIVLESWREIIVSLTWTSWGDYKRHGQWSLLGRKRDEATHYINAPQATNNRKPSLSRIGSTFQNRGSIGRTKSGGRLCDSRRPEWGMTEAANGMTMTSFPQAFHSSPVPLIHQKPEDRESEGHLVDKAFQRKWFECEWRREQAKARYVCGLTSEMKEFKYIKCPTWGQHMWGTQHHVFYALLSHNWQYKGLSVSLDALVSRHCWQPILMLLWAS